MWIVLFSLDLVDCITGGCLLYKASDSICLSSETLWEVISLDFDDWTVGDLLIRSDPDGVEIFWRLFLHSLKLVTSKCLESSEYCFGISATQWIP